MKADLSLISMVDSEGLVPCHVSMDHSEEFVFTAKYTSGNIAGFPIKDSGHLNKVVYLAIPLDKGQVLNSILQVID